MITLPHAMKQTGSENKKEQQCRICESTAASPGKDLCGACYYNEHPRECKYCFADLPAEVEGDCCSDLCRCVNCSTPCQGKDMQNGNCEACQKIIDKIEDEFKGKFHKS